MIIDQSVMAAEEHPPLHSGLLPSQQIFQIVNKISHCSCSLCFSLLRKMNSTYDDIFFVITLQLSDFFRLKIPVIIFRGWGEKSLRPDEIKFIS